MTLKENAINIMKEELDSIIDNNPAEGVLGIINNRRAFAKTETYRKLRKNELSNEEMYFLLNNYKYETREVAEFLVDAISDFTTEKLITIGGLESMLPQRPSKLGLDSILSQPPSNLGFYPDLANALIEKFKIDNPSKSLQAILEYLIAAERVSSDIIGVSDVMDLIIRRRFNPHLNRKPVSEGDSEKGKELLIAIKDNYSLIFNLMSKKHKREEETDCVYREFAIWSSNTDNFSKYISDNYSDQASETASFLIKTVRKCPYVEIDFVIDYINTQTELPTEVQLIILYTLLCSNNLDPIIDFDKVLNYCEYLYKKSDISKGLHEILALVSEGSTGIYNNFIMRVSNLNDVTKERLNAIYKHYFKNQNWKTNVAAGILKLKAMIGLKVPDLDIAEEVRSLRQGGTSTYYLISEFSCDPEKPYSYPGPCTMKELMIMELTDMPSHKREHKDYANMLYKDLIQEFFFKNYIIFNSRVVMTWKMANDPSFIKSFFEELTDYSHRMRQVMEVINIKNIGFKKYVEILEDIQRNSNSDRPSYSNELGHTKNTFPVFHQKALKFATESEINMYKHKIPISELLSSRYCTYEVIDYFLKKIEGNKVSRNIVFDVVFVVVEGVRNNKKLTQDQQIDILVRIGKKPSVLRFFDVNHLKPKTITFNVANSKNLTVKDFQSYYSKIRGAK